MNNEMLFKAVGEIDDIYILSAYRRLEAVKRKKPRRLIVTLAAVLVLLMAAFTTGMALNEDFREFVFETLRITTPEQVPDFGSANTQSPVTTEKPLVSEPEKIDIGGVIEGRYIHAPMGGSARNGVFLVCTDEVEMNSGSHYDAYMERSGEFVKLEEYYFSHDYTILGNSFHVEFEWAKTDAGIAYTYIARDCPIRTYNFGGTSEAVLVYFNCQLPGEAGWTNYPVLLNFETGEITDILAGTGAESLANMYSFVLSGDKSGLIICCWDLEDTEAFYYADLAGKRLLSIDELSGETPDECSLVGNTIVCWVLEGESGQTAGSGCYRAWAIDLNTLSRREIFSDIPANEIVFIEGFDHMSHWGNMYPGSCFAVGIENGGSVCVYDLVTGEKTAVDGFVLPDNAMFTDLVPSPDGKKLLIHSTNDPNYSQHIYVINMEDRSFVSFDRVNENAYDQHTIYWYDNEQIIICGETKTEDGLRHKDYYIYTLK